MTTPQSLNLSLMFGMLALHLEFVSPEQLCDAIRELVQDKTRPLGELLVQGKLISADEQRLLEALVERHLTRRDSATTTGFHSCQSQVVLRQILNTLGDEELNACLSVLDLHDSDSAQATGTLPMHESGSREDRFRVLRPHARGGLGEVVVAMDTELNREVALKRIQPRHADDPDSRSRFLLEAEITGRLEHPGIIPVYALGHDATGQPFYAMRFVRGESMKDRIRWFYERGAEGDFSPTARAVGFRRMLGQFVDLCEAIAYAHSRGVLHRDIKPSNVMLGKYGETLVVDWGLAKVIGTQHQELRDGERTLRPGKSGSHPETVVGSAVGTPAFMSPEQAAGKMEDLDVHSDVYGLGATFYMLLTGQPPFDSSSADVLQKVERGEFEPPESRQPRLPRPLASICKKAMRRMPDERYRSARELANEIERWLADEPVAAHPESPIERVHRIYRRHRTLVLVASLCLLLSTVGLLVSTSVISQQKNRAQQNAQKARQLALSLLDTAEKRLSKLPRQVDARKELTNLAVNEFRALALQDPKNLPLRMQLADSLLIRANLLRITNLEEEAESDYVECIELYASLVNHTEWGDTAADRLVGARVYYAAYLRNNARLQDAIDELARAKSLLDGIADKGSTDFRRTRARFESERGRLLFETGAPEAAAQEHEKAAGTFRSLILAGSKHPLEKNLLIGELESLARALLILGQSERARKVLEDALRHSQSHVLEDNSRDNRHLHALILSRLGRLLVQSNPQDGEGTEDMREAIRQWLALIDEYPSYLSYQRHVAAAKLVLAESLISGGQLDAAAVYVQEAYDELKKVVDRFDLLDWKTDLVDALAARGRLAAARGLRDDAIAEVEAAIELQNTIVKAKPLNRVEEKRLGDLDALRQEFQGP